ncbi:unnamed protein product [Symbiodinium pilosum]|uniref:Apple domain-containing protein n=1 Tax=Symbiodinium pilosum TaxID=2952 RepID=A0A812KE52_SYMPI|nr:unnamed protein product [Symbiodinium pilosum]
MRRVESTVDVLYIYPEEDHNGAFSMCSSGSFEPSVCFRLVHMAHHYSVHFVRVGSVQEATAYVKSLPAETRLKHVVFGGHGNPTSLAWGDEADESDTVMPELRVDEPATRELLSVVYPHLIVDGEERTRSTVFLDACLNGKTVRDKNMLLFVAHQLAGTKVFASQISFDNSQFVLDNYLHFNAHIMSNKKDKMVSTLLHPGLRELEFHPYRACKIKQLVASAQTMESCAESCQKAGDGCEAFTYFPDGNARINQVCYHSKRCSGMKRSKKGAMVFTKATEEDDDESDEDDD